MIAMPVQVLPNEKSCASWALAWIENVARSLVLQEWNDGMEKKVED